MRCLRSLRDRCSLVPAHQKQQQQQQHVGQIDAAIRPYLSVVELCDHQHLYEGTQTYLTYRPTAPLMHDCHISDEMN